MIKNNDAFFRGLFLTAALYDFVLGTIFLIMYKPIFSYLNIVLPTYPMYLQLSSAFVIAMGVGYYFVYQNIYRNVDLVKLGIVYKLVYSGFASYFYFIGLAHALFFFFAILDGVFVALFIWFLMYVQKDGRYCKWS